MAQIARYWTPTKGLAWKPTGEAFENLIRSKCSDDGQGNSRVICARGTRSCRARESCPYEHSEGRESVSRGNRRQAPDVALRPAARGAPIVRTAQVGSPRCMRPVHRERLALL